MATDDEMLRGIEEILRAPGELFLEEWDGYQRHHDGPPISTIWFMELRDDAPNEALEFEEAMAKAWDLLCDSPAFLAWFEENEAALRGEGDANNVLTVDDGGDESLRFSRTGNLNMRVPVETLRTASDLVAEFQRVMRAMLVRRAHRAGVPSPELG
jgi:hypothetical protein